MVLGSCIECPCFAGVLTRLQSACLGEQGAPIGGLYLAGRDNS